MSAAETIAKSTTIVENGGSAVASVNGKIGVVELNYTDVGAPPSSRTINGKSLEEDIILTAQDVGASTTEDVAELETQVTTNTRAIGTLDNRTSNHALAIEALQNEIDEHTLQSEMMFLQRDRVANLLVNSNFANPVNWQGLTEYKGNYARTIDGWGTDGPNKKVVVSNGYVRAETTTGSSYATIMQKVVNNTQYAGKTLTAAAYLRSNVTPRIYAYNGDTGIKSVEGVSGDYQVLVCSFTVPANISDGALLVKLQGKSTGVGDYLEVKWAALYEGAYTADTLPAYVIPDKRIEMIRCGVPLNPPNLLDNSWFVNPIAQAGQNGMHGSTKYVCDRWISWDADATFANGCITPGSPIDQRISLNMVSVDKTYTVAFCLSDGTIKASSGTLRNGAGSFNFGMHAIAEASYVRVRLMTGFEIRWAALYEGAYTAETIPTYHYKGYAAELAECQRYFQKGGQVVTVGTQYGTVTKGIIRLRFCGMRSFPNITITGISSQGWGNIAPEHFSKEWTDQVGTDYFQNYMIEGDSSFVGQTIGVNYEASADL